MMPDAREPLHEPLHEPRDETRAGGRRALDQMLPSLYQELRRSARRELAARPSDMLSTTALVHELYLKLTSGRPGTWHDRAHFLAAAVVTMRHILVDHARRRAAGKRGGAHRLVALDDAVVAPHAADETLLELDDALERLARLDARLARVVESRFFAGMTERETAIALGVDERTVRRDWVRARGFLRRARAACAPRAGMPASGAGSRCG
jgi:RNA polymerase sigma factor (TIGR02999 family)